MSIQDFEIVGEIGQGAFGKVFHAIQISDGKQVALKVIRKELASDVSTSYFIETSI